MTDRSPADRQRLRVLVLAPHPYYQDRGTPIAAHELVSGLTVRGYEVELFTYHEGADRHVPGCTLIRTPRVPGVSGIPPGLSWKKLVCDLVMLLRLPRLVRDGRIDVVHAIEEGCFMALLMKRWFGVPYVYDMDSSLPEQLVERFSWLERVRAWMERFERRAIGDSLGVVAVSRTLERIAREVEGDHLVARLEDFSLLDTAEDVPGAVSEAAPAELLRETIGRDGPLVLYVGNLMPYQGIDLLLAAFRHTARRHATAQLVIVGGSDGDIAAYRTQAAAMGLEDRVHLVGPRPMGRLGWYLRQADVLVSPRTTGTNTPMKIYSYLDSGAPLLATALPTHSQVLDDDIALMVAPDPAAFGDGMLRLLGDSVLRRRLAAEARRRVRTEYSRDAYRRKLNAFYQRIERRVGSSEARAPVRATQPVV